MNPGDDAPHPPSYTDQDIFWKEEAESLSHLGVAIYTLRIGNSDESLPFW